MKLLPLILLLLMPVAKAAQVNVSVEVTIPTTIPPEKIIAEYSLPIISVIGIIFYIVHNLLASPKSWIKLVEVIVAVLIITAVTIALLL